MQAPKIKSAFVRPLVVGILLTVTRGSPATDFDAGKLLITAVNVVEEPRLTYDPVTKSGTTVGDWTVRGVLCAIMGRAGSKDIGCCTGREEALARSLREGLAALTIALDSRDPTYPYWPVSGLKPLLDHWPDNNGLKAFPARLCAIVNRFDRAELAGPKVVRGAEIRFEYELLWEAEKDGEAESNSPGGVRARQPHLIVEVEFAEVPAEDFRRVTAAWFALGELDPIKLSALTRWILAWPLQELRLRILSSAGGNGVWHMAQLKLSSDGNSFIPFEIAEQAAYQQGSGIGSPINYIDQDDLATFVATSRDEIASGRFTVPDGYRVPRLRFIGGSTIGCSPKVSNDDRHRFALNQCVGCHSGETETNFLHIGDRLPGQPSAVSAFLSPTEVTVDSNNCPLQRYRYAELERRQAAVKELLALTKTFEPKALQSYNERRSLFRSVH